MTMGKHTKQSEHVTAVEELRGSPAMRMPPKRFSCSLVAPTPVAFNPLVVEAETEGEAKAKFLQANGISASDHPFTATPI